MAKINCQDLFFYAKLFYMNEIKEAKYERLFFNEGNKSKEKRI